MTYPNSVLDSRPTHWGWPWHGLIDQQGGQPGITLGSGRRMPVPAMGGHWTYLWDIGMPEPEVDTDDPDEQWWNVAILRGSGALSPVYGYGGMALGTGPVVLEQGVGNCTVGYSTFGAGTMEFTVDVRFRAAGGLLQSSRVIAITPAQIGITLAPGDSVSYEAQLVDRKKDGTGLLIRVWRSIGSTLVGGVETGAIIEITIGGDAANASIAHRIVSSGLACRGAVTVNVNPTTTRPPVSTVSTWGRARIGTETSDSQIDAVASAWYLPDGTVDLVRYRCRGLYTRTQAMSGGPSGGSFSSVVVWVTEITLQSAAGTATITVQSTENFTGSLALTPGSPFGNYASTVEASMTFAGEQVRQTLFNTSYLTDRAYIDSDLLPSFNASQAAAVQPVFWLADQSAGVGTGVVGRQSAMHFQLVSNKIIEWQLVLHDQMLVPESQATIYYSAALTPAGVDSGTYSRRSNQPGISDFFELGAFNPVTGQTRRHQNTPAYSWV